MDLLDVAIEEGYPEQIKQGEEATALNESQIKAAELANEGKPEAERVPVPEKYKFPGTGLSVPTENNFGFYNKREPTSLDYLKKLLPTIPK
jgi:hypothetical protein